MGDIRKKKKKKLTRGKLLLALLLSPNPIKSICYSKQVMLMKSYCGDSFKLVNTKKVKAFFTVAQCVAPFFPRQFIPPASLKQYIQ